MRDRLSWRGNLKKKTLYNYIKIVLYKTISDIVNISNKHFKNLQIFLCVYVILGVEVSVCSTYFYTEMHPIGF